MARTTFHIFRHAEGVHQVSDEALTRRDAELTEAGRQQCAELRAAAPDALPWKGGRVRHVISSPLRRTLQSCLLAFEPVLARPQGPDDAGLLVVAVPDLTEAGSRVSSFGSDPAVLAAEFNSAGDGKNKVRVDLSRVEQGWNSFDLSSKYAYSVEKLETRAADVRAYLRRMAAELEKEEETHVIVMTHSVVAHFVTEDYEGIAPDRRSAWADNLAHRSYRFEGPDRLVETPESRVRTGLPPVSTLTDEEKRALREHFMKRHYDRTAEVEARMREAAAAEARLDS